MSHRRVTGRRLTAAGLLAAAMVGSGCSNWVATEKGTQAVTAAASPGLLHVRTENGSVEIRRADVTTLEIDATIRATTKDRLARTQVVAEPGADGSTRVHVIWPDGGRRNNEGCSLVIRTPISNGIDVDTSNGSVLLLDLNGPAVLDTSNGAIDIERHRGSVHADTSNGRIRMKDVQGEVDADTSNGGVELVDVRGPITVDTSNGGVVMTLASEAQGPFTISTSNGTVRAQVGSAFSGVVDAETSNGSVRVSGARSVEGGKHKAKAQFGEGGGRNTIRTSNGGVEIVSAP